MQARMVREIKRVIMLVRNPYDTLWAYYQLLYSLSHRGYITSANFDQRAWQFFSAYIAKYFNSDFHRIMLPVLRTYDPSDVTVVRYEDLLNSDTAVHTLRKVGAVRRCLGESYFRVVSFIDDPLCGAVSTYSHTHFPNFAPATTSTSR